MTFTPDALPAGLISLSEEMRILAANAGIADMVGRQPADLIGEQVDVLLTAPSRILFQTHVYPALKSEGRVDEVFLTLDRREGPATPVLLNAIRTASSESPRFDAVVVRVEARSRWEVDLLATTRELERERAASARLAEDLAVAMDDLRTRHASEERSREFRDAFIGVVSHELRTPITTIFGMSHVLRDRFRSMDVDTLGQHLADIHAEADRMRRLTEDLLVLSRAEGGGLRLAPDPIVLRHLVAAAVAGERARATGHEFVLDVAPVPLVLGEEMYVEQVIRNFLTNATKYSPPGTTITVEVRPEDDGASVRVSDEGQGFGDEPPERLFDLFYRSPHVMRQTAGAGIGLFVCRELIAGMGGRIWAEPGPAGATFGFWLPPADESV